MKKDNMDDIMSDIKGREGFTSVQKKTECPDNSSKTIELSRFFFTKVKP